MAIYNLRTPAQRAYSTTYYPKARQVRCVWLVRGHACASDRCKQGSCFQGRELPRVCFRLRRSPRTVHSLVRNTCRLVSCSLPRDLAADCLCATIARRWEPICSRKNGCLSLAPHGAWCAFPPSQEIHGIRMPQCVFRVCSLLLLTCSWLGNSALSCPVLHASVECPAGGEHR